MKALHEVVSRSPLLPYIRETGYAVREPWFLPERCLLDYLLIYVQEGLFMVQAEGQEHRLEAGDFCLIQPNQLHTLRGVTRTITPFVHMDLFYLEQREQSFPTLPGQVDLSAFAHLLQPRLNDLAGIQIPIKFVPPRPSSFKETLLRMIGLWENGDLYSRLEAEHLANELILLLLKSNTDMPAANFHKPQSLNWITSYFSFHLHEPLYLSDMAKRAQLSPSRFSAVFKEHFGVSPHQYLLRLRIQHAQELLNSSSFTLQDVAEYCGFADIHHFSKAFKKIVGASPGMYRRKRDL